MGVNFTGSGKVWIPFYVSVCGHRLRSFFGGSIDLFGRRQKNGPPPPIVRIDAELTSKSPRWRAGVPLGYGFVRRSIPTHFRLLAGLLQSKECMPLSINYGFRNLILQF